MPNYELPPPPKRARIETPSPTAPQLTITKRMQKRYFAEDDAARFRPMFAAALYRATGRCEADESGEPLHSAYACDRDEWQRVRARCLADEPELAEELLAWIRPIRIACQNRAGQRNMKKVNDKREQSQRTIEELRAAVAERDRRIAVLEHQLALAHNGV